MDNKVYEITYKTDGGEGCIKLHYPQPNWDAVLAEVEQTLANTGATDIVYTIRAGEPQDFEDDVEQEQLSIDEV